MSDSKSAKHMNESDVKNVRRELSEVNELRRKYLAAYKCLRDGFIDKCPPKEFNEDKEWCELWQIICDMRLSSESETIRRVHGNRMREHHAGEGLYTADKLCCICGLPLTGRQRKYCTDKCKIIAQSRRYRKKNPEAKERANLKYLQEIYSDTT